jgi:hypothetical protein
MQKKRTFKAAFTCRWAPSDGKDGQEGNDGVGIKTADVVFKLSTSDTQQPDNADWVTLFSQLQLKERTYVWSCTRIELTNGTTTYTGKQCLGSSKDFVTITEQYAVGNSPTTAPTSGWGTTYTPTKELWLWTRNRMEWKNGTYTYSTPLCVSYFSKDGKPGLIERTSEWAAGVEFHNDENLTGGIRYLDLVTVTNNTTGKFELYQCRVTHTSTAANAPSDNSAEWLKLNQMRPIYTPLIVAKNAVLRFSQTNRILITNSKDKVQGCFGGVEDETNGYPLWIGAITAAAAKFRVKYGGQLEASEVSITGTINATSGTFNNVSINSGTIGGFTISGNGLTNDKNFNNDAYIILRNDNAGAFAGIGGNLLPASSGLRAVARFENENKSRWFEYDSLGQNIAMMLSAKNADRNVALEILGGCIKGFALNTKIITNKTYTISRDENVVSYISDSNERGDWVEFTLPDMQWYDEGHFVMLSRESVGDYSFKVKPGYCYDKSGKRYETYIYNKGRRYTKSGFDTDFFSAYGSCILVYCPRWQVVSKNAVLNKGIWLAYGVM